MRVSIRPASSDTGFISGRIYRGWHSRCFTAVSAIEYLRATSIRLSFDKDTLIADGGGWRRSSRRVGLCVLPAVDVFFDQGSLLFSSFCYANQIFDLAEYNKPVTQLQIDESLLLSC